MNNPNYSTIPEAVARLWPGVVGSHMMRDGALAALSDVDLQFNPGGTNSKFGELFRALGDLQHTYIDSFNTLQHDWSYTNKVAGLADSVAQLQAWFAQLDAAFQARIDGLSDDDLNTLIDRGNGVERTFIQQLEIYGQAMLIFLGKVVVYFNALDRPLPPSIQHYIA